ncbi:MAG TPA: EamA family transporter, partial [Pseudomonadota bacterium]|nr:EamA family transporter [Pseudomonadota bacterium]
LALGFLAIFGSVIAWSVYLALLRRLDLSVLSTIGLVQPVFALVVDLAMKEAQLGLRGYVGALLVLVAMALSTWPLRR